MPAKKHHKRAVPRLLPRRHRKQGHALALEPDRPKRAMSLVELLVVVAVVAILATLSGLSYSAARRRARDSMRKEDLQTYLNAITAYQQARGSSFIETLSGASTCTIPNENKADYASVIGSDCSGANKRSFGALSIMTTTNDAITKVSGFDGTTYHYGTTGGVSVHSVGAALNHASVNRPHAGYMAGSAQDESKGDPLLTARAGSSTALEDYVFIRCKLDGTQSFDKSEGSYAVWATLEGDPTEAEVNNSAHQCGGSRFTGEPGASDKAQYDFGLPGSPSSTTDLRGAGSDYTNWLEAQRNLYGLGRVLR